MALITKDDIAVTRVWPTLNGDDKWKINFEYKGFLYAEIISNDQESFDNALVNATKAFNKRFNGEIE